MTNEVIEIICREWLIEKGCPHSVNGFNYVCCAVSKLYFDTNRSLKLMNDVYHDIGIMYDVTPFTVAQSINYFIKCVYDIGIFHNNDFKCYISPSRKTPTNREFLYAIADYLRLERSERDEV